MATEHVLVVGAGQMGAGIAQVALQAGLKVTLVDVAQAALDKGAERIRAGLAKLVEKGKLDDAKRRRALEGLPTTTADLPRRRTSTSAIEAVTENEELKKKIFKDLDAVVRPGGVLATQHLVDPDHPHRRGDHAARGGDRDALHEPGAADAAGRAHPRRGHQSTRPTPRPARSPRRWARPRSSRRTSPASS